MLKKLKRLTCKSVIFLLLPYAANAAYVQSAVGNAVINDASAVYYNPGALVLVPNQQLILAEAPTSVYLQFNGTATQNATRYSQTGTASSRTYYFLPYLYYALPINDRVTMGIGGLYNYYGIASYPTNSIVRYNQTYNFFSSFDITPGVGVKLNDKLAIGLGLDFIYANASLKSMTGYPSLGVADNKSINNGRAYGLGAHLGVIGHPFKATLVGFTYHSAVSLKMTGHSSFDSTPEINSSNFNFKVVTPPHFLFSLDQFLSKQLGFLATIEHIRWNTVKNLNLKNVANRVGSRLVILPTANIPYHLKNTWRFALTTHYQTTPKLMLRGTVMYDESPENPHYLIGAGNNIVLGANAGYSFNKQATLDLSYAHIFYETQKIRIQGVVNTIAGHTTGDRNIVVAKLTWNMV